MAIRVYRIAVVGCPRRAVEPVNDGSFAGVGKSCLCNRFVKPGAYTETHESIVSSKKWTEDPAINGDHFLYWGATTRHLQDGSKARFQVVEQTEFYDSAAGATGEELQPHSSSASYLERATLVRIATSSHGKVSVRLKAEQASVRAGGVRSTTQIFPNEDFGGKNGGVLGYACVFDPTLVEEQMKRQMVYLADLLQALNRRKKKIALVCTKCDQVGEEQIKLGASLATCALRKPIPFFEVSSQDDINVEDVFFSLIGHAKKSPKIARSPKSPKSSRHYSVSASVPYHQAVALQKHNIHRAKDAYRRLLQKKITSFSAVWSEAYLVLEKEEEFSVLLQLAGEEGKEMVKNMFCLRLIEIKLMEGAKLFGMSSASKKLNKEKSMDYQRYLSDALKSHPDLRNDESVYDYVYSTGVGDKGANHIRDTSISSDTTIGSRSNCDSPDNQSPLTSRRGRQTHSLVISETSERSESASATAPDLAHVNNSMELLSSHSPHPSPLPQTSQSTQGLYNYGSNPNLLESSPRTSGTLPVATRHSEPLLDVAPPPPPPPQRYSLNRQISNSMDALPTLSRPSGDHDSESVDNLNAEPYLQPREVQMVMHTLPRTQKIAESNSYHSMLGDTDPTGRKQQNPVRMSAIEISDGLHLSKQESLRKYGHRRAASNPWILDGNQECPLTTHLQPQCPVPPPVPKRDYHRASRSPPLLNSSTLDPHESSLDFPRDSRRSIISASLSPKPSDGQPQPQYADIDEMDNVSTVSGPFEEISDDPDSSNDTAEKNRETKLEKSKAATNMAKSPAHVVKKKSSELNSDYEKIEEYVAMAPSSALSRRSMINPDTPNPSERTPKKTTAPPPKAKKPKGWSRYNTDSVIPDAATVRSSSPPLFPARRSTMSDSTKRSSTVPNVRPLPPSPSKAVTSPTKTAKGVVSRNSSSGSNIYETIDDELLNRVNPRRRGSGLPKWAPPVAPKHYAQYMVILRKFFTDPHIISAWEKTIQEIIPGGDMTTYPPPYSNLGNSKQAKKLGATVEVPKPRGAGADTTHRVVHQISHARESSNDQYILPILTPQVGWPQSSSTPVTPALQREGVTPQNGGRVSSARAQFAAKRPASREDFIEMLNMSAFNQGDSSDSESSESDEESEGEREDGGEEGESEEGEDVEVKGSAEGDRGEGDEGEGEEGEGEKEGESEDGDGEEKVVEEVERDFGEDRGNDKMEKVNDGEMSLNHASGEDFDSIMTDLNPAFDSVLAEPDSVPDDTTTTSDSHTHIPADSTHQERDSVLLRSSVSTDSDLDSGPLLKPSSLFTKRPKPSGGSRIMKWVNTYEQGENTESSKSKEKSSVPPVPMRKPARRREVAAVDGMSDSGISNCHSQTYDDGFTLTDTNQ